MDTNRMSKRWKSNCNLVNWMGKKGISTMIDRYNLIYGMFPIGVMIEYSLNFAIVQYPILWVALDLWKWITDRVAVVPKSYSVSVLSSMLVRNIPFNGTMWQPQTRKSWILRRMPDQRKSGDFWILEWCKLPYTSATECIKKTPTIWRKIGIA